MSQSNFKGASLLTGTALVALGVMAAGQANAGNHTKLISSGNDKTTLKIAGQVSRQITVMDDGDGATVRHSDSDMSSSRILITSSGKINKNLRVGTKMEIAVDDARNAPATETEHGGRSGDDVRTRKTEIYLTHALGKVSIGAGDMASNGITEMSYVNYAFLPGFIGGAIGGSFRKDEDDTPDTDERLTTVSANFGQGDGLGRSTRVRYDSPNVMGFMLSLAHEDNQAWDAALRYSGKFLNTRIKAGMAYWNDQTEEGYGASVAFNHASGFGVAYTTEFQDEEANSDTRDNDPYFQNAQLFYTTKLNEMGKTQFVYEYNHHENKRTGGFNAVGTGHSFGVHQKFDAAASEVVLRYTHVDLNTDAEAYDEDDIDGVSMHFRVKF